MEPDPHYNFRDVLWAPARALSAKQILSMTIFLLAAIVAYDLFAYIAFAIDGQSLSTTFSVYGFFPMVWLTFGSLIARIVYWVGCGLAVFSVMLGFFTVAAFNIEAIRGNHFLTTRQAIRFALCRAKHIFLAEVAIVLFVAFIVLLFFLLGLVSRLPVVGEWIYTVLFVIPNFIIALFSIFIIFVFTLTVLLLPITAAADRVGETFTAILETFSTIIRQPFRWLGYTLYSFVAAKVCGFIYAYFCYRAVQFMAWSASLGGGDRLQDLVKSGLAHLPVRSDIIRETFSLLPWFDFGVSLNQWVLPGSRSAASHFMAFMLFLIFASIIGYMLAIIAAAQARGYVALRYIKDEYRVADEDPLFFTDEHVNPKVEEGERPHTRADDSAG
ncbi:MAG: hypothetical protein JSU65_14130 [Candidatus Zixiibacteriota bacterium]|nr:MAG: hypothetical protein JSU65_14130 [candidate division Zixibacteria bacterium]